MLLFSDCLSPRRAAELSVRSPRDAVLDPRGFCVRCTPDRRTLVRELPSGVRLYRKVCSGRAALREWRWLHVLGEAGFSVPAPAYVASYRGQSVVAFFEVPGRSLEAWAQSAVVGSTRAAAPAWDPLAEVTAYAQGVVAPAVRRLHRAGIVFRDLFWGHLFAADLAGNASLHWIDLGRVLQPRWRRRRWIIKDLAGLLASAPHDAPGRPMVRRTELLRFYRAYEAAGGGPEFPVRALLRDVADKARRIRAHRPKFGATQVPRLTG